MKNRMILLGTIALASVFILFILFDLGFFWSLIADGKMDPSSSGGRYQYSHLRRIACAIFYPDKQYRPIGNNFWMSEVIGGYWCMSDEDVERFRTMRG